MVAPQADRQWRSSPTGIRQRRFAGGPEVMELFSSAACFSEYPLGNWNRCCSQSSRWRGRVKEARVLVLPASVRFKGPRAWAVAYVAGDILGEAAASVVCRIIVDN